MKFYLFGLCSIKSQHGFGRHVNVHSACWLWRDCLEAIQLCNHYNATTCNDGLKEQLCHVWARRDDIIDRQSNVKTSDINRYLRKIKIRYTECKESFYFRQTYTPTLSSSSFLCIMGEVDPSSPSVLLHWLPTSCTTWSQKKK